MLSPGAQIDALEKVLLKSELNGGQQDNAWVVSGHSGVTGKCQFVAAGETNPGPSGWVSLTLGTQTQLPRLQGEWK